MVQKWTENEINQSVELLKQGYNYKQISEEIGRKYRAVEKKMLQLGETYSKYNKPKPKYCINCGGEIKIKEGKKFCSQSCAASYNNKNREHDDNTKNKISNSVREYIKENGSIIDKIKFSKEKWQQIRKKRRETNRKKLMEADYKDLKFETLRKRIILEQDEKCNKCGVHEWFGKKIPLEMDHKDGDNSNNERENLEALCPNCHSITDTWRGKNKKCQSNMKRVSDEELFKTLMKNEWNMRASLLEVGLAAKGGNYNRCHRLKRDYTGL